MKSEVKVAQLCLTLRPQGLYSPWNSPGQNTGLGSHFLLQGISPTQGSDTLPSTKASFFFPKILKQTTCMVDLDFKCLC